MVTVTGSSSGFGRLTAEIALARGDRVVATLRDPEAINDLVSTAPSAQLLVLKLDVTKEKDIPEAFQKAKEAFGRIDVVFNNAGYGILGEVETFTDNTAKSLFETNFWGAVNVSTEAVRFFRDVNVPAGGRLLTVSSVTGMVAYPLLGFYSATKHGQCICHFLAP